MSLNFKFHKFKFVHIIYSVMLAALVALPSSPGSGLDSNRCLFYLSIVFSSVIIHLVKHRSDNWLRPDVVFLLGFLIVHYQWLLMILVSGVFPELRAFVISMEAHATYGAWISTIALISWLAGYAITYHPKDIEIDRLKNKSVMLYLTIAFFVGFVVSVESGYFTAELYRTVQVDFTQTVTGISAYFLTINGIFSLILLSIFFYPRIVERLKMAEKDLSLTQGQGFKRGEILVLISYFSLYIIAFLIAGERGQIIQIISAISMIYAVNYRPIRFFEFALLAGLAAVSFTIIGIARALEGSFSADLIFGNFGFWAVTQNLAQSSITLYQGIDLIHTENRLFFGQLWLSQVMGLVPFLQSGFLALTGWGLETISSASLITDYITGPNLHTGFGTSFVIDTYMNFGIPGIIVFSFLYGYVCKIVSAWLTGTSGFPRFFVSVAFVSLLFYVSRSSLLIQLQPVVWGLLFIMLFVPIRRRRP